jgi:hypothetical protein
MRTATNDKASAKGPVPKGKRAEAKTHTVMSEFKSGELKSSSGQKVTNPKQAVAIALSEARRAGKGAK